MTKECYVHFREKLGQVVRQLLQIMLDVSSDQWKTRRLGSGREKYSTR